MVRFRRSYSLDNSASRSMALPSVNAWSAGNSPRISAVRLTSSSSRGFRGKSGFIKQLRVDLTTDDTDDTDYFYPCHPCAIGEIRGLLGDSPDSWHNSILGE